MFDYLPFDWVYVISGVGVVKTEHDRMLDTRTIIANKRRADAIERGRRIGLVIGTILTVCAAIVWGTSDASDFISTSPDDCPTCFNYFDDVERVWDGDIRVLFNPGTGVNSDLVPQSIERAIRLINIYADVPFDYQGETSMELTGNYFEGRRRTVIVAFNSIPSLGQATVWWNYHRNNNVNYGEVELAPVLSRSCLDGTVLHEFLHILNIRHSDNEHSIMFAEPYNTCEYQSILRLDDINALQSLYPARPNRQGIITSFDGEYLCDYRPEVIYLDNSYQVETCAHTSRVSAIQGDRE